VRERKRGKPFPTYGKQKKKKGKIAFYPPDTFTEMEEKVVPVFPGREKGGVWGSA